MLVIARKTGQTLLIGDDIEVTVSAIRGDQVRLAINAPREISVLRKEVVDQVAEGNLAAMNVDPQSLPAVEPRPSEAAEPA